MSLYPSLEDMTVDKMAQAQVQYEASHAAAYTVAAGAPPQGVVAVPSMGGDSLYGHLYDDLGDDWMGMNVQRWQPPAPVAVAAAPMNTVVAPPPANDRGAIQVAQPVDPISIRQGVRQVVVSKDAKGKLGVAVKAVSKGVFVSMVWKNSAAAAAGLRFGDQILQVNGENMAGYSSDKALKVMQKASAPVTFAIRDRVFERTITLMKDSTGHVGFEFKNGEIKRIRKESSAARNGLLIDHKFVEVNGQNTVGLKDKEVTQILQEAGQHITITVMPTPLYDHMVKNLHDSALRAHMTHNEPVL